MPIVPVTVPDLTTAAINGTGVFDILMRANKAHLEEEFGKNRIKGSEYATVYLGSLESVMSASVAFLLQKDKNALEAQLLEQQIILTGVQVDKANAELAILTASLAKIPLELAQITAQTALVTAQTANATAELAIIQANALKVPAEILHIQAQTALVTQQKVNLIDELLTATSQRNKIGQEILNLVSQELQIDAQITKLNQETTNLTAEGLNIPKQGLVLDGTKCKLDAEFSVLQQTVTKTTQETALLSQKTATEAAQVSDSAHPESVIGKQKALYAAQTSGFARDAEQKAAKLMVDTWNVRRTTDEGVGADTAGLGDGAIAAVITKMRAGISA